MNILVTGASGFIGSALVDRLIEEGHSIIALSRRQRDDVEGITWINFDMSRDDWNKLKLPTVQVVFHLAGQTSVYRARENPLEDFNVNVLGVVRMLDYFCNLSSPPYVILAGTVTQAGIVDHLPISEHSPDKPITFYDVGKLTAELYLKQYVGDGLLRGCVFRLTNVFGKGSQITGPGRSILDFVFNTALSGRDVQIYGTGDNLRDYIHISDVVSAFLKVLQFFDSLNGNMYYLGTGVGTTVAQAFGIAVDVAFQISGKKVKIEYVSIPPRLSNIEFRNTVVDISPYINVTGWVPLISIESGLRIRT